MTLVLDAVIRSSILLTIGLVALWLLRKQPAALRHWVLAAALGLAVAQPVITQIIPALQMPAISWVAEERAIEPTVETRFAVHADAPTVAPVTAKTDWPRLAFLVWAAGAAISLAILLFGALWLTWLGSQAIPADHRWQAAEALLERQAAAVAEEAPRERGPSQLTQDTADSGIRVLASQHIGSDCP